MKANLTYLENEELYDHAILQGLLKAKNSAWIATANLKDIQIQVGSKYQSIVKTLAALSGRGMQIRLLHSGVPSENFMEGLKKYAFKFQKGNFKMKRCPRVHFKAIIMDQSKLYIGSANLTGAGIGAKKDTRRNFELGFISDEKNLIVKVSSFFNVVWSGRMCDGCGRKKHCPVPLEEWKFETPDKSK